MILFDEILFNDYKKQDVVSQLLTTETQAVDTKFASQRWLLESFPKRMIYARMYGDLLDPSAASRRVLDVGGGYTALTRRLVELHDYTLLDIMAHDAHDDLRNIEASLNKNFWQRADWYQYDLKSDYDLVIANDIFPNVDQRLSVFLERFLPHCHELRLSLTYYNIPRWYQVKRTDADEIFHMLAWDGAQVQRVLEEYRDRIDTPDFDCFSTGTVSLFPNQRQVCMVVLHGDM